MTDGPGVGAVGADAAEASAAEASAVDAGAEERTGRDAEGTAVTEDPQDGERTAPRATTTAPVTPPSTVKDGWMLDTAIGLVRAARWSYVAPMGFVAVVGALSTVLMTAVNAWTAPTMLRDGAFTSTHTSTATLLVAGAAMVVLAVLTARAMILLALRTAGDLLGHPVDTRAARDEVRRRWVLVALWAVGLLVLELAAVVGLPVAMALWGSGTALLALVVLVGVQECAVRTVAVAAVHGISAPSAALRIVRIRFSLRDHAPKSVFDVLPGLLLLLLALPVAGAVWGVRAGAGRVPEPFGHALTLAALTAVAIVLPVFLTILLTVLHLRASRDAAVSGWKYRALPWTGVDRSARPAAEVPSSTPLTARRRRLGVAALALLAAPTAFLLLVATNPTPAIRPTILTFAPDWAVPSPLLSENDTLLLVVREGMSECVPGDACRVVSLGTLPSFAWHNSVAAAADPDGAGVALVVDGLRCANGDSECESMRVLVTCEPANCFGEDVASADRTIARVGKYPLSDEFTVAAHDGTYAVVAPEGADKDSDQELVLTLCATASCQDPQTFPLGPIDYSDVARAQFAPDGTLWVVRTDEDAQVVRAWTLAPGASTLAEAFELDLPMREAGLQVAATYPLLHLSIRGDGTPVLLHRDLTTDELVLTSCDDTRCTDRTTTTLPIDPTDASLASLAVDTTGRPILATAGEDGVLVHSCTNRACTDVRTGWVSDGYPVDSIQTQPFMTLDAEDRPVFAVTEHIPNPDDPYPGYYLINRTLWCEEARCGL